MLLCSCKANLIITGMNTGPRHWSSNVLLLGYCFFAMVVAWSYSGNLIAGITKPGMTKVPKTLEDLAYMEDIKLVFYKYGSK